MDFSRKYNCLHVSVTLKKIYLLASRKNGDGDGDFSVKVQISVVMCILRPFGNFIIYSRQIIYQMSALTITLTLNDTEITLLTLTLNPKTKGA